MGGRGAGSSMSAGGGPVSATSTGGKIVQQSDDQWYGENDNGSAVVINYAGSDNYNLYKYGNKTIYEVNRYDTDAARNEFGDQVNPPRLYANNKAEAMQYAKGWLKANKNKK